ncbi:MAG: DNA repair protein RecN [Saprospiraceae bacterium]|nr:DNA repair protein RecN [Saprospiraceae bacterium]
MLKKIEIQNYAIIDRVEIEFPLGLNIITGETGAGKSILLGALGLIMGKRADTKVLYDQERKCYVEATFDIKQYALQNFFASEGLDYDDELIIRREIAPGGKSRAFINDSPVTLDLLQQLSDSLIDIHQQFDLLDIHRPAFQLEVIDALAGNQDLLSNYKNQFKKYRQTQKKLAECTEKQKSAQQESDFLAFQMEEFEKLNPVAGELDEKEQLLKRLTAAEDIKKITGLLSHRLDEDEMSVSGQLRELIQQTDHIKDIDSRYMALYDRLTSLYEEVSDLAREAADIADSTEYDAEMISVISERLNQIYRLLKKHSLRDMQELLEYRDNLQLKLDSFGDLTNEIVKLNTELTAIQSELESLAQQLSQKRKSVTSSFEKNVHDLLVQLAMEHAYIQVKCNESNDFTPTGKDEIIWMFAPNKGSAFLPLKDIASGGEISRLTLCIKSLVANAITLPTLIFDEIDTGVSGEVALKMGVLLSGLAKKHQVISITHSPQIAAKADHQFFVYKSEKEHRTVTGLKKLNHEERIQELAKMLSGDPPTPSAIANAKELLDHK